jgi:hypothetical protein
LRIEEFDDFYPSSNIIGVIKSSRMMWTEKVTRMEFVKCVELAAQGSVTLPSLTTKWGITLNLMFYVLDDGTMNTSIL